MSVIEPAVTEKYPKWMSREQLAWTVLLVAFATFLVLAVTVPLSANWYLHNASVAPRASIQGTRGTTSVKEPNARSAPVAVVAGREEVIVEGSELRTDDSQALVSFFDRSTLTIFPNSAITLKAMREPRFARSNKASRIVITVHNGRVRAQVAPSTSREVEFEIQTPHALAPYGGIVLQPGSYAVETSNEMTHVSVRSGEASVSGQTGQKVTLESNERAQIALGASAVGPLPAKRNLLLNSDFQLLETAVPISDGPLVENWFVMSDQGGDGGDINGVVEVDVLGPSRALHFTRQGSNSNHGETAVVQKLNKVVDDYRSLLLRFDVKIVGQSLSGGGERSSEFPIMIRIDYRDAYGGRQHWTQGFYSQNEAGFYVTNGIEVPKEVPYPFEVDLKEALDNPQIIESIKLYASGWDWESYISEVELIAE
ncbi:MAG: FecR family protein [Chloroflexota bacterium]|nr:FecR family protein [Chloroflexota bacterium]